MTNLSYPFKGWNTDYTSKHLTNDFIKSRLVKRSLTGNSKIKVSVIFMSIVQKLVMAENFIDVSQEPKNTTQNNVNTTTNKHLKHISLERSYLDQLSAMWPYMILFGCMLILFALVHWKFNRRNPYHSIH